jgi:hypothetical protein
MSIYATLWTLQFPAQGDEYWGCEWETVMGQGVLGHIGTPTEGYGYESGDPYASFLPPAIPMPDDEDDLGLRAMVIIRAGTEKKEGQEYIDPLLVLSGDEYLAISFHELQERISDALRGSRPRVIAEFIHDGEIEVIRDGDATKAARPKDSNSQ